MENDIEVLETKQSETDFGSIGTNIPITCSIPVNTNCPAEKQDSLTQIEYTFPESTSATGSLTQIQSHSEQQQQTAQQQSEQQTRLLSLQELKSVDHLIESAAEQAKSIPNFSEQNKNTTNNNQEERKQNTQSQKTVHHTSHYSSKHSSSNYYNFYNTQHKKLIGVSVPNRIFPLNTLVSSSQKLQTSSTSNTSQPPQHKSAKVLRLLKKDLTTFPSSMIDSVSTATSIPNINTNSDNIEDVNDPTKMYESNQVRIDENDILETKIHNWLDTMDIHITCPSSKMHDYFDNVRQYAFRDIQGILSGEDLDCFPTPSSQSSLNYIGGISESPNPFTPTPRLERRISGQLTTLLPTCNFLNRRRLTLKLDDKKPKEIEEVRDEWDQD